MAGNNIYTAKEAAKLLGISSMQIRKYAREYEGIGTWVDSPVGGYWTFTQEDIKTLKDRPKVGRPRRVEE